MPMINQTEYTPVMFVKIPSRKLEHKETSKTVAMMFNLRARVFLRLRMFFNAIITIRTKKKHIRIPPNTPSDTSSSSRELCGTIVLPVIFWNSQTNLSLPTPKRNWRTFSVSKEKIKR